MSAGCVGKRSITCVVRDSVRASFVVRARRVHPRCGRSISKGQQQQRAWEMWHYLLACGSWISVRQLPYCAVDHVLTPRQQGFETVGFDSAPLPRLSFSNLEGSREGSQFPPCRNPHRPVARHVEHKRTILHPLLVCTELLFLRRSRLIRVSSGHQGRFGHEFLGMPMPTHNSSELLGPD